MPTKSKDAYLGTRILGTALALVVLSATTFAASLSATDEKRLLRQRNQFQEAERLLERGDLGGYRELLPELEDYPLYPYLAYAELRRRLSHANAAEIEEFLDSYGDTPLASRLRRSWLKTAYRKKRWLEVLRAYRSTSNAAIKCRYIHALLEIGQADEALAQVEDVWLVGYSQPPACDPVFEAWRDAQRLTPGLTWSRIRLAMKAGRPGLARYLSRYLPEDERYLVELWRRVRSHPPTVMKHRLFWDDRPEVREILVYGIARWARRAPEKAAEGWRQLEEGYAFNETQVAAAQRAIGLRFASHDDGEALRWLGDIDDRWADQRVRETGVVSALRTGQWEQALVWIGKLEAAGDDNERWGYWRARSLAEMGEEGPAMDILSDLANERSFYGFMAADHAGLSYSLNESPLALSEGEIEAIAWNPGIRRARELFLLGRNVDARREWHYTTSTMSSQELAAAAALAHRLSWHDRAILTLGRTEQLDDLKLRFPLAYREPVMRQARELSIDPAWVFAVMRQESAFSADARSPAGAMGLMQLMPRTARLVARHTNTRYRSRRQLYNADLNIQLGSAYLRRLLDQLDEHPALATAAYNAGPHRVKRWLPKDSAMPSDLWIESVPFHETRDYLKRVFAYTAIYEQRLGQETTRLSERLTPVPSKNRENLTADKG